VAEKDLGLTDGGEPDPDAPALEAEGGTEIALGLDAGGAAVGIGGCGWAGAAPGLDISNREIRS